MSACRIIFVLPNTVVVAQMLILIVFDEVGPSARRIELSSLAGSISFSSLSGSLSGSSLSGLSLSAVSLQHL